jgi:hypothetical protein
LSGGTPAGGVYTGSGISGGSFLPGAMPLGNYTVNYRYTDANGCASSANDTYAIISKVIMVNLYPNPASQGQVTVAVSSEFLGGTTTVFNASGQKVAGWRITSRSSTYKFKWPAGTYYFNISNGSNHVMKTLVITR